MLVVILYSPSKILDTSSAFPITTNFILLRNFRDSWGTNFIIEAWYCNRKIVYQCVYQFQDFWKCDAQST